MTQLFLRWYSELVKDIFPEFYPPKKGEFKTLWADALFVFDTNVLLSLYRYPPKTQTKLLAALKKLKKRLWIPHQVALEFHRRRIEVICAQEKTYKEMSTTLGKFKDQYTKHPFLHDKQSLKVIKKSYEAIENEIKHLHDRPEWLIEDNILESIEEIFKNKIGTAYDKKRLKLIYEEGADRYEKKIPPGYEDIDKDKFDRTQTRKYGDLIIWYQIIDKAKEDKKPIIFITADLKEDWWWKEDGGRNIGARYELKKEIKEKAGVVFHMYQVDQFIEHSQEHLNTKISKEIISEIKKVREEIRKVSEEASNIAQSSPTLAMENLSSSSSLTGNSDIAGEDQSSSSMTATGGSN